MGGGRLMHILPWQSRSMEMAASWPCATAQMMFLGPKAASPPKKTFGLVDCMVAGIDLGHVPFVELQADIALDPGEGVFLAHRHQHIIAFHHTSGSPDGTRLRRPLASNSAFTFSNARR